VLAALIGGGTPESLSRVLQGLITGIGFLGAGVILHHRKERRIEGLTTAASIWVAAGLGAACGAGLGELTAYAIVAAMIALIAGGPLERAIARQAEAERERRAKVIHAEGELQASEKLLQAAEVLAQRGEAMQLRYLQTLTQIAGDKASTIVFPVPMDIFARLTKGD
jgi:uncharacterized membrane protein YhiD involved in acid resistance